MPTQKNLKDLFSETLKDIYFAEKQILRALPKMAKEASSPELKQAFETHREQTEGHVERLNEVFELLGRPARGKTCEAILGIIDEAKEIIEDFKGAEALDAGLASSAQAVEHYEIARYGTLKTWAQELGLKDAAKLLDETLQEEIKTDQASDEARDDDDQHESGLSAVAQASARERGNSISRRGAGWRKAGQALRARRPRHHQRYVIQRHFPFSKRSARPWAIGASAAFAGAIPAISFISARATPPCETTNASPANPSSQGRRRAASIA
jgi:ferritin-like metal-binding protein YciE